MRLPALLTIVALTFMAGCGTTGDGDPVAAKDDDAPKTTTTAERADPPTTESTDDTEPDGGDDPTGSVDEEDLERVLPVAEDLPPEFTETEAPEDDTATTTYQPSAGCEAMAEWFSRKAGPDETLVRRSFEGTAGSGLNIKIRLATDELRTLFDGMGKELEQCKLIRATSDDYAADANLAPGPLDLGDAGFVVDMHVVPDDMVGFPPTGITNIGVLHGDYVFSIQLTDGLTDDGQRITRDPMIARDVATRMEQDLDVLLGD